MASQRELVEQLFEAALSLAPMERDAFLQEKCSSNLELKRLVQDLLAEHARAGSFLQHPPLDFLNKAMSAHQEAGRFLALPATTQSASKTGVPNLRKAFQPGTILSTRFKILRLIGRGGMGEVYEAEDLEIHARVALKTVRPEISSDPLTIARFKNELHFTHRITHPNVCRTFDLAHHSILGENGAIDRDVVYITMELLDGQTLADRLRSGPLPTEQALNIACQAAEALDAAHKAGVIHGDLKPSNVMLCDKGLTLNRSAGSTRVVVMDFGLARGFLESGESSHSTAESAQLIGTLAYMAPEQLKGHSPTTATDIYALGLIMFEMITGNRPLAGSLQLTAQLGLCESSSPSRSHYCSSTNPELQWEHVLECCLATDPAKRYSNALEVVAALASPATGPPEFSWLGERVGDKPQLKLAAPERRTMIERLPLYTALLVGCFAFAVPQVRHFAMSVLSGASKEKVASSRRVQSVIMTDILNNTGDPTLDRSVGELISTSLEQSPYLKLFPAARLPEVLKRMNLSPSEPITALRGLEICKREGLEAEISGSISRFGAAGYTLVVKAVDADGDEITSDAEKAADVAQIPSAVERVSGKLRAVLGEDQASLIKYSAPLEKVTSSSLLALKIYSVGKEQLYDGNTEDAVQLFKRALELDPGFAMAREYMGISYNILNDSEQSEDNYLLATRLVPRVTERERLKIFGDYYMQIQDYAKAIFYLKSLSEEYPLDGPAHLNLGQAYLAEYQFDNAMVETRRGLELQPGVGSQNNLAEIYFLAGDTNNSIQVTSNVISTHPHDVRALFNLGRCHLVNHEFSEASRAFEILTFMGGDAASRGHSGLADLEMSQGKYHEGESQLEAGLAVDRRLDNHFSASLKVLALATVYYQHGKGDKFAQAMSELPRSSDSPRLIFLAGLLHAKRHEAAQVRRALQLLSSPKDKFKTPVVSSYIDLLTAELDMSQGKYNSAIEAARAAVNFDNSTFAIETLARAYYGAERDSESIQEYERLLARANERTEEYDGLSFHRVVEANYWLGVLYYKAKNFDLARKHLVTFLAYWPQPDFDAPLYRDARLRLQRLGSRRDG